MSLIGSKRVAPARRASPSRDEIIRGADKNVEHTFQQKLQEIKKMRMSKSDDKGDKVVPKKVQTVNGLKTFLKRHGDWVEVVSKSKMHAGARLDQVNMQNAKQKKMLAEGR